MRCSDPSVTPLLVGLQRVGVVGLRNALAKVSGAAPHGREAIVDAVLREIAPLNYIPDPKDDHYRTALWREYLRHTGGPFQDFFSEVSVTVAGPPGADRDRFVEQVRLVLAKLELRPIVAVDDAAGSPHTLVIRGELVATAAESGRRLESAIRHSVSDW